MDEETKTDGIIPQEETNAKESDVADIIGADLEEKENPDTDEKTEIKPEAVKTEEKRSDAKDPKSDWILVGSIIAIILVIALVFSFRFIIPKPKIVTLEDVNKDNIQGKLNPELGYMYKGVYSFIYNDGLWLLQLQSPNGRNEYNIALHYGARDVENITVIGNPSSQFANSTEYYITFNPTATELQYTTLAVYELDNSMIKSFQKKPIAACDRNETAACDGRPIITCENSNSTPVVYFQNAKEPKAIYTENCLIIQGEGLDIVRVVDRILLNWYGVME